MSFIASLRVSLINYKGGIMTRTEIYDSIQLLDHFGDHCKILGLTVGEIELLNAMKVDLTRRLCHGNNHSEDDLHELRGYVRRQAPGPCR